MYNDCVVFRILGTGILRSPKIPREFDSFEGPIFHTAKWDHDCNLKNKVLAVIGVGSSGIQVIPELAKIAKKVIIYQRFGFTLCFKLIYSIV